MSSLSSSSSRKIKSTSSNKKTPSSSVDAIMMDIEKLNFIEKEQPVVARMPEALVLPEPVRAAKVVRVPRVSKGPVKMQVDKVAKPNNAFSKSTRNAITKSMLNELAVIINSTPGLQMNHPRRSNRLKNLATKVKVENVKVEKHSVRKSKAALRVRSSSSSNGMEPVVVIRSMSN